MKRQLTDSEIWVLIRHHGMEMGTPYHIRLTPEEIIAKAQIVIELAHSLQANAARQVEPA